MTYQCPSCGTRETAGEATCPRCGADLSLLQLLASFPDAWFNEALFKLDQGQPGRALEFAAAAVVANPSDAASQRLLARLWARFGHPEAARDAWDRAAVSEPGNAELGPLAEAIGAVGETAEGHGRSLPERRRRLRRRRRQGCVRTRWSQGE